MLVYEFLFGQQFDDSLTILREIAYRGMSHLAFPNCGSPAPSKTTVNGHNAIDL